MPNCLKIFSALLLLVVAVHDSQCDKTKDSYFYAVPTQLGCKNQKDVVIPIENFSVPHDYEWVRLFQDNLKYGSLLPYDKLEMTLVPFEEYVKRNKFPKDLQFTFLKTDINGACCTK